MEQLTFDLPSGRPRRPGRLPVGRVDDDGRECAGCGTYKLWVGYSLAAGAVGGHCSICRECRRDRRREARGALGAATVPRPASLKPQYTGVMPLQYGIYVYRCWTADDTCIYVGKTRHALRRLGAHALMPWWRDVHHVDVACMTSWAAADAEEIAQIRHWRPVNNSQYNRTFAMESRKEPPPSCLYGHEYTEGNTLYNSKGSRICRECKNARAAAKRIRKGLARGERNAAAKLTPAAVADCRRRRALGQSISALSRDYGVTRTAVRNAINGVTWMHIREDQDEPALHV